MPKLSRLQTDLHTIQDQPCTDDSPLTDNVDTWVYTKLLEQQDHTYREFHCRLMPTIDPAVVIGVRMPKTRTIAKELARHPEAARAFMCHIPHTLYEEKNIHGLMINEIKSFDEVIQALDVFLPEVDNWATCDLIKPRAFKPIRTNKNAQNSKALLAKVDEWIACSHPFTVRFGISMLMQFYLNDSFSPNILARVERIQSTEYYVNMMRAWFFAEALVKQEQAALPVIEQHRLDIWTHNKAIQKAIESYRISVPLKKYLRTLKMH